MIFSISAIPFARPSYMADFTPFLSDFDSSRSKHGRCHLIPDTFLVHRGYKCTKHDADYCWVILGVQTSQLCA